MKQNHSPLIFADPNQNPPPAETWFLRDLQFPPLAGGIAARNQHSGAAPTLPLPPFLLEQPREASPAPALPKAPELSKQELAELIKAAVKDGQPSTPSRVSEADFERIRTMVREEARSVPLNPLTYVSLGIGITAFGIAIWSAVRASSKRKQDFDSRRNDREELLFGREFAVVQEPKQLIIQEVPSPQEGAPPVVEVDDPRLQIMSFNPDGDIGQYTLDIAKRAAAKCSTTDHFLMDHFGEVHIPRVTWFFDSAAERDRRHMVASFTVEKDEIARRALVRFKRELKIIVEKAFSEGAIDALEGKMRKRQNLFVIPLSDICPDGGWTMRFLVVSELDLQRLRDTEFRERAIADNPEKRREIEMVVEADRREQQHQAQRARFPTNGPTHREGHSRYMSFKDGRYMIPVAGWLRPKNGK